MWVPAKSICCAVLRVLAFSNALVFSLPTGFGGYILAAGGLGLAGGFSTRAGLQFVAIHCRPQRWGWCWVGFWVPGKLPGAGFNY